MVFPASDLLVDPVLIRKYDGSGPRYTSYPTADRFVDAYGSAHLRYWLLQRGIGATRQPLALYFHVPFCESICYYCACNKVVTRDRTRAKKYIKALEREMEIVSESLGDERGVCQIHWGGGTPNFLGLDDTAALMQAIDRNFRREPDAELAVEIDPRHAEAGRMQFMADLGFNRVSFGVQDFDPAVQAAVHRVQSEERIARVIDEARASGFRSVNVDLIYGLPRQSLDSFDATLEKLIALSPDRVALYGYAHLPERFKPQRRIAAAELPSAETRLQILMLAIGRLTGAGYVYIGMDHFAKPGDDLAVAQSQGRLKRNFQGYSSGRESDLLGFGMSAIGAVGPTYYQNQRTLEAYYAALEAGRSPVCRGVELSKDDLLRRAVIQALACDFRVSLEGMELNYLVDFRRYFADEMNELRALADDGLVEIEPDWIKVTPHGRLLVRAVCMVFDRYLRVHRERNRFSQVI
jgi:oxygen-independent coproporphyrinogen-3 oxidase